MRHYGCDQLWRLTTRDDYSASADSRVVYLCGSTIVALKAVLRGTVSTLLCALFFLHCGCMLSAGIWREGWDKAVKGSYVPPSLIVGDAGTWGIGDTVSHNPQDCGQDQNLAEIVEIGGAKTLRLTSVYHPSASHPGTACGANNVWADLGTLKNPLLIPVTADTMISFTESGSLIDPVWNSYWPVINPPAGDVVYLKVEVASATSQTNGSVLVYIFQRASGRQPRTDRFASGGSTVGYHEVLIGDPDSPSGNHLRSLFQDLSDVPGFNPVSARIYFVEFTIKAYGTAALHNLTIGSPLSASPPRLLVQPQSQTVTNGCTAVLNVSATGTEPLRYQWYAGQSGDQNSPIAGATAASFTTPALTTGKAYWVQVTNVAGSANSQTATITVLTPPVIKITRIWSDQVSKQVPGVEFNSLPPDPVRQWGAGRHGDQLGLIVMGARDDNKGYVKCEVQLIPADSPFRDKVIVRLVRSDGGGGELARQVLTGSTVALSTSLPAQCITNRIEAWVDLDSNGAPNPEHGEVVVASPGEFAIVSKEGYEAAMQELRKKVPFPVGAVFPIAYRFLDSFLNHTSPEHSLPNAPCLPITAIDPSLDLNVGVDFDAGGGPCVPQYSFPATTDVAAKILASGPVRNAVVAAVARHLASIREAFADPSTLSHTFSLSANPDPVGLDFPEGPAFEAWDLYYAFREVDLTDAQVTVWRQDETSVGLSGIVTDLYDFGWHKGPLSEWGALVQAGYPTLGPSGRIFRTKVLLDGKIQNVRYDGRPSLRLSPRLFEWGPGFVLEYTDPGNTAMAIQSGPHGGQRVVAALPAASAGTKVMVEASIDLQTWQRVSELILSNGVAEFVLPTEMAKAPRQFFRITASDSPPGMVLIPAGPFTMGNTFAGEGESNELPLHTNQISAFYMDQCEVTKALWDEVCTWANTNGYDLATVGFGQATNHPVYAVSWYDAVKWCNARSEWDGRVPGYYTSAAQTDVYRSGQMNVQNDWVKWNAGYRLPTEAEWEKAARGGVAGRRFPWSDADTIAHSRANYCSSTSYAYDTSLTRGYHPSFDTGQKPYTNPVGYFATNGYGLYDMTGNVWERCWDWYGSYSGAPATDPRGPASGSLRVCRGGGWDLDAFFCRAAYRGGMSPDIRYNSLGFRSVLPPGQL
jgi:sulfatase modifying factor 1